MYISCLSFCHSSGAVSSKAKHRTNNWYIACNCACKISNTSKGSSQCCSDSCTNTGSYCGSYKSANTATSHSCAISIFHRCLSSCRISSFFNVTLFNSFINSLSIIIKCFNCIIKYTNRSNRSTKSSYIWCNHLSSFAKSLTEFNGLFRTGSKSTSYFFSCASSNATNLTHHLTFARRIKKPFKVFNVSFYTQFLQGCCKHQALRSNRSKRI